MKQNLISWHICFIFMCVTYNLVQSRFLGGTISWVPDISSNAVRFTYRLSWEKGTGPCGTTCSQAQIGSNVTATSSSLSSLRWKYKDNSSTNTLSDINYYVTSVSKLSRIGWEQGENAFTSNSSQMNNPAIVYLDSIPWVRSSLDTSDTLGYMETKVDLGVRSDTAKPNASPFVSLPAFLGVAFGCSTKVRLPADDPDGDIIRCRWAEPTECGQACTNVPSDAVKLSKANCTITVHAFSELGLKINTTYRVALMVEDFPHGLIDVEGKNVTRIRPLSKIPMQLTIRTSQTSGQCDDEESNLLKHFGEQKFRTFLGRMYVKLHGNVSNAVLNFPTNTTNLTDIMASVPRFTTYPIVPKKFTSGISQISINLAPRPSQYGYTQFCFWLLQMNGVATTAECLIYTVNDDPQCKPKITCKNNGTCVNLYNVTNDICDCPDGYKPTDCSSQVECADEPCENKGSCQINGAKYQCLCQRGFGGSYCEQERNHCETSPCRNNATCLDLQNGFKCLCTSNFTGEKCDGKEDNQKSRMSLNFGPIRPRTAVLAVLRRMKKTTYNWGNAVSTPAPSFLNGSSSFLQNQESPNEQRVPAWIAALASIGGLLAFVGLGVCIYKLKPDKATGTEPIGKQTKRVKQKLNKVQTVEMTTVKPYS